MKAQAIALCRVSSKDQTEGHSLDAQQASTQQAADELGVDLVKSWNIVQSTKKGKNFKRRDLEEMLRFCRRNKQVKYLLLDFANRFGREVEVMIYWKVRFNELGVELFFCSATQRHLNGDGQYAQLMRLLELHNSETENESRAATSMSRMKQRYQQGFYLSHPHAGYRKSETPGIHIPDKPRFDLLQKGSRLIISEQYTPKQAIKWMNDNGYRTSGGRPLDTNHYMEFITDRYYRGKIDIRSEGWPKDVDGLHTPMFSTREHNLLVAALTKRNPRVRYKHNPAFPMANLARHYECMHVGKYEKFSGHDFNRGKRPNGTPRKLLPVYDCRDCRRRIRREKLHAGLSEHLESLKFLPDEQSFKKALIRVWKQQRGSVAQHIATLQNNKQLLEEKIRGTASAYAIEPEGAIKASLKLVLEDYDAQLKQLNDDIRQAKDVDMESGEFVRFAIDFTANIRDRWWDLSWENHKRGEQVLFNGEIYADNSAIVHTPNLSSIYRLGTNKKALENASNAHLEELAGTAPASVSLFG